MCLSTKVLAAIAQLARKIVTAVNIKLLPPQIGEYGVESTVDSKTADLSQSCLRLPYSRAFYYQENSSQILRLVEGERKSVKMMKIINEIAGQGEEGDERKE